MMRRKVIFYPMYEETLVVESTSFDDLTYGASYTHHWTLKTPRAATWGLSSLLRELADRLETDEEAQQEVR
jgi:hypothetical protein